MIQVYRFLNIQRQYTAFEIQLDIKSGILYGSAGKSAKSYGSFVYKQKPAKTSLGLCFPGGGRTALPAYACERMLEASGILFVTQDFRARMPEKGICCATDGASDSGPSAVKSPDTECLEILTFWNGIRRQGRPSPARKAQSQASGRSKHNKLHNLLRLVNDIGSGVTVTYKIIAFRNNDLELYFLIQK